MDKILILGHKSPDTDSICSALAYADLKTRLGANVEAVRLGKPNAETQFALDHFQMAAPRLVETVANEVKQVILVDHNERQQSVADRDEVQVLEVIDHHRIANFETAGPVYYRGEPVGCTSTILNKMFKENKMPIGKSIAGLMLSAIISDTLLMKSPTCTADDVAAIHELAVTAGVEVGDYGIKMLKAGADLSDVSIERLLSIDAKEFQMGQHRVEIAQVNAVDTGDVLNRKAEVLSALAAVVERKTLSLFLLLVTDILASDSIALAVGPQVAFVEKALNVTLQDNQATLKGVVSRKKQIVPVLTEAMS